MSDPNTKRTQPASSNLWILRAQILLQRSLDDIDAQTRSRLNRGRQHALAALDAPTRIAGRWLLHWIGSAAISAGVVLFVWQGTSRDAALVPSAPPQVQRMTAAIQAADSSSPVTAPDFELLADEEQFVILQDLEFYAWLEANDGNEG